MSDRYVNFGDIARGRCGTQCQYGARYTGIDCNGNPNPDYWKELGYPDLGKGLRFRGDTNNYHSLEIHEDDVEEFARRYKKYKEKRMNGSWEY